MANPASTIDLGLRFHRPLTDREQSIAQQWLDDAYDLLLGRRPTLEADVTAGTVKESTVVRVLCAMVARVFINPEGNLSEQIDDYSYSRDALVASGALTVTQAELADITPGRRASRSVRLIAHGETT
jgi:hypothetical protein